MSGLFDNRNDGKARRQERSQKEQTNKHKQKRLTIIVVSVLIIAFVGALIINSSFLRRTATAVSIDGRAFSAAEFDYFYNRGIMEYTELVNTQMPDFASALLPARGQLLSSQIQDPNTGETWADFFRQRAKASMAQLVQLYNAANAAGFTMSEEDLQNMENAITAIIEEADFAVSMGQFRSPQAYLQFVFGSSMNEAVLRDIHKFIFTAISYNNHVRESVTFTQAQLEEFYLENQDRFDIFTYRILPITPEAQNPMDFTTGDELADAQEEAQEQAVALANQLVGEITTEDEFIAAARAFDEELFGEPDSTLTQVQGEFIDPTFVDWLTDASRTYGDTITFKTINGAQLLFFVDRNDNNYQLASMRQILLLREQVQFWEFPEGENDPEFIAAVELAEHQARERALAALAAFEAAGGTEEALIALMEEYSDDTTPGGFYENIAMFPYETATGRLMRIVPELEQWLFDESRQFGDFELIHTEAFGYHLMFFAGRGDTMRNFIATDGLRTQAHSEWSDTLPEAGEAHRHW